MTFTVFMGSPRQTGNTAALLEPFLQECEALGITCRVVRLYEKQIEPCIGCMACQRVENRFGCVRRDDMEGLFALAQESDLLLLATPIYAFFCTAPMKAAMDRMIYAGCKFYGGLPEKQRLLKELSVASITTCGYGLDKGADLWEEGLRRFCKHAHMDYLGMLAHRDMGDGNFMSAEKADDARAFCRTLAKTLEGGEKA